MYAVIVPSWSSISIRNRPPETLLSPVWRLFERLYAVGYSSEARSLASSKPMLLVSASWWSARWASRTYRPSSMVASTAPVEEAWT